MDEQDPIKQLQHLLDDPDKLLEKISRIQSTLGSLGTPATTTPEQPPAVNVPAEETGTNSDRPEPRYSRVLKMLQDLQAQLEERVLPLARAKAQAEVEQLRDRTRHEQIAMNEYLAQTDRLLVACLNQIHESQRKYADLTLLNQKLAALGCAAEPLPDFSPSRVPAEIIDARIELLRRAGRL